MGKYASTECPVCQRPLENGDDIVVCPICGAPYHKPCYRATGHCVFPELHETGESWQPPCSAQETCDGSASLRCSRCNTLNPSNGLFCQVCGNKLNDAPMAGTPYPPGGFPGMPFNPFTTPYGGVAPDESIDEVPAKDLAILIGKNSHYFLPRFKAAQSKRGHSFNGCAFLFLGWYFLYRKMYAYALWILLFTLLLAVPGTLLSLSTVSELTGMVDLSLGVSEATLTNAAHICNFLTLALRFLCGFFANHLYFHHCQKKIRQTQALSLDSDAYYAALSRKGGVAHKLIIGLVIAYGCLCIFSMYATAWLMTF